MNELKIGSTVRLKHGPGITFIVAAFYDNGVLTTTQSEFAVIADIRNMLSPHVTLHYTFLQLVVLEESTGPSVH